MQLPSQRERDPGLTGFVISLVGLFTFGILSPIGLGLNIATLVRDRYSALAKVGIVLGVLGVLEATAILIIFGDTIHNTFTSLISFSRHGGTG